MQGQNLLHVKHWTFSTSVAALRKLYSLQASLLVLEIALNHKNDKKKQK